MSHRDAPPGRSPRRCLRRASAQRPAGESGVAPPVLVSFPPVLVCPTHSSPLQAALLLLQDSGISGEQRQESARAELYLHPCLVHSKAVV